ncbi:MAG: 5-oxoprolinase subunit PxpA [Propionicimonas sp.]|nr:5-oxoprolinase subunit PxpA [Propionicimonas sp.]MEA5054875.1 5-oxoprolinase subunit PxpA [Propionicimonas sp.]
MTTKTTTKTIDLVADLGEGFGSWQMGDDDALLEIVSSANIACGFHAGDPLIMDVTVAKCVKKGVALGAHPSFPDLRGFGRYAIDLPAEQVRADVMYQLGALAGFAQYHGARVAHIAPHGKLGNLVAVREDYAEAIAEALYGIDPDLIVMAGLGTMEHAAKSRGMRVALVGNVDRAYLDDGTLVPRGRPGAVLSDPAEIAERAVRLAAEGVVVTTSGAELAVDVDTILVHGDTPEAVETALAVRQGLEDAGIRIAPVGSLEQ